MQIVLYTFFANPIKSFAFEPDNGKTADSGIAGDPLTQAAKQPPLPGELPKDKKKKKFYLLASVNAFLTFSELAGGSRILGGSAAAALAPVVRFNDKLFFIGLYDGAYKKSKQVFAEDEGPRLSSENTRHSFTPTLRYVVSPRIITNYSVFRTQSLSRETTDEDWYGGLYDYNELGASVTLNYLITATAESQKSVKFLLQRFKREYPNFSSLLIECADASCTLTVPIAGREEREKDSYGTTLLFTYNSLKAAGLSYSATFSWSFKDYLDKLVETDGCLPPPSICFRGSDKQRDDTYGASLSLALRPGSKFDYQLTMSTEIKQSSQNFAEGSFPGIVFHENYYSYVMLNLAPGLSYTHAFSNTVKLELGAAYSISRREYDQRRARDGLGNVAGAKEIDWTHNLNMSAMYSINRRWSFGGKIDYSMARSNNKDERTFRYSYEIFNLSLGLAYKY
ncbi:MAG: hypothetical protein ACE5EN_11020 [Nitrospinota bacterium]